MAARITFVTLAVAEPARARSFYERLGFAASRAIADRVVFVPLGGVVLALWDRAAFAAETGIEPGTGGCGSAVSLNTDSSAELDRLVEAWRAAGGRILAPPHETPWGAYAAWATDPDGHLFELVWNPRSARAADGPPPRGPAASDAADAGA